MPTEGDPVASPLTRRTLTCRSFSGMVDWDRRIASFAYPRLERAAMQVIPPEDITDLPDRDDETIATEMPCIKKEPARHVRLSQSAPAGTCLHDILEHVDFTAPDGLETKISWR